MQHRLNTHQHILLLIFLGSILLASVMILLCNGSAWTQPLADSQATSFSTD